MPAPKRLNRAAISTNWDKGGTILQLPKPAADLVRDIRRKQLRGKTVDASLDGHLPLCRTKLAAALMLLHDERTITMEHWDLAGVVIDVSNDTRERVQEQLAARTLRDVKRRGHHEGVRAVESAAVQTAAVVTRTIASIVRVLGALKGEAPRSDVRRKVAKRDRPYFDEALSHLIATGAVAVIPGSQGTGERLKMGTP